MGKGQRGVSYCSTRCPVAKGYNKRSFIESRNEGGKGGPSRSYWSEQGSRSSPWPWPQRHEATWQAPRRRPMCLGSRRVLSIFLRPKIKQRSCSPLHRGLQVLSLTVRTPPFYATDWMLGYTTSSKFKAQYRIDWDGPLLGKGTFGVVRKATDLDTGKEYAVKTLTKSPSVGGRTMKKIQSETTLVLELRASLDVGYCYGIWEDEVHVHMLLELCRGGDITTRAEQRGSYSEVEVVRIVSSALRVVAECHTKNFVHRDIKPENFMYLNEAEDSPIRAIDFGLATPIIPGVDLGDRCGTVHYCAPEVILYKYGKEADLWSVGVMAYQLLTGSLPFSNPNNYEETNEQRFNAILYKEVDYESNAWRGVSQQARAFVQNLLIRDRHKRMTAAQALDHEWLKDGSTGD